MKGINKYFRYSLMATPVFYILCFILFIFVWQKTTQWLFLVIGIVCVICGICLVAKTIDKIFFIIFVCLIAAFQLNVAQNPFDIKEKVEVQGFIDKVNGDVSTLSLARVGGKRTLYTVSIDTSEIQGFTAEKYDYIRISESKLERYKKNQGVVRVGSDQKILSKSTFVGGLINHIRSLIDGISERYFAQNAPLLKAMIFGLSDELDSEDSKVFRQLGLGHVLVASGANIVMILSAIGYIFNKIRFKYNKIVEVILITIYFLLIGLQGSMIRAFIFFMAGYMTVQTGRDITYLQKVLITICLTILIFPDVVLGLSFLLSFLATLALKFTGDMMDFFTLENKYIRGFLQNIILIMIVNVLTAFSFHSINLAGIFTNIGILILVEVIVGYGFVFMVLSLLLSPLNVDLLWKTAAVPLNLLISLFNGIIDFSYTFIGTSLNYKFGLESQVMFNVFIVLTALWIFFNYKKYKYKVENTL